MSWSVADVALGLSEISGNEKDQMRHTFWYMCAYHVSWYTSSSPTGDLVSKFYVEDGFDLLLPVNG